MTRKVLNENWSVTFYDNSDWTCTACHDCTIGKDYTARLSSFYGDTTILVSRCYKCLSLNWEEQGQDVLTTIVEL